jgi:hypothetical protein
VTPEAGGQGGVAVEAGRQGRRNRRLGLLLIGLAALLFFGSVLFIAVGR